MVEIGETMPLEDPDREIYLPGPDRWHALITRPQGEAPASAALHRHGVYSFFPVRTRVRLIKGREVMTESRYLPGYLFAKFPGRPILHRVMARIPWVTDAIRVQSGAWAILRPADLRQLYHMRSLDTAQEREARRAKRRRNRIAPGDRVAILSGLWGEGQETEVLRLTPEGKAVVNIRMFGADMEAEADVARLRKIV